MKLILWEAMLDSDFNSRYWRAISEKYSRRDSILRFALALSASGTVAGWSVWSEFPWVWKGLSGAAAIASIASPILALSKKAETSARYAGLWIDLRIQFSDLWERFRAGMEAPIATREYERLRKVFRQLEVEESKSKIPRDLKLARQCQSEVLESKGLTKERANGDA